MNVKNALRDAIFPHNLPTLETVLCNFWSAFSKISVSV